MDCLKSLAECVDAEIDYLNSIGENVKKFVHTVCDDVIANLTSHGVSEWNSTQSG